MYMETTRLKSQGSSPTITCSRLQGNEEGESRKVARKPRGAGEKQSSKTT